MSGNNNHAKKRRTAADGAAALPSGQDGGGIGLVQELNEIKSAMKELLDQSRVQSAIMTSMQGEIKGVRGEIKHLRDKCDSMEKSLQSVDSGCGDRIVTRLDNVETRLARFDDVENRPVEKSEVEL